MSSHLKSMVKIIGYEVQDVMRSKWIIFYFLFFLLLTDGLFRFGDGGERVVLSLMNVILLLIPLMSAIFGAMYLYNAREFIELMLSQPISRPSLFGGLYIGLAVPLVAGYAGGMTIPFLIHGAGAAEIQTLLILLVSGIFLTLIFVGLAFGIAILHEDRVKGLSISIFNWLLLAIIYDSVILLLVFIFSDYPLEKPMIAATLFNPIDLARILLLLNVDIAALMGYTGAVFERFFRQCIGNYRFVIGLDCLDGDSGLDWPAVFSAERLLEILSIVHSPLNNFGTIQYGRGNNSGIISIVQGAII